MSTSLNESGTASEGFTFAQRVSMLFGVEAAALSGMSILVLILYKLYCTMLRVIRSGRFRSQTEDACDSSLFLSLMIGETLRAIGKLMTVRWIQEARIIAPTGYCTAQGMVQLIGTNIIDWSTLAISVQTWVILVVQWNAPAHFAKYLVMGVWLICALIVGVTIGAKGLDIIGPAGTWCWITPNYTAEQILSEYLWMWIILCLTIVCYTMSALVIAGYLTIQGRFQLRWVPRDQRLQLNLTEANTAAERERKEMALQLFFYPLVYFICVLPFTITRWMCFAHHQVPHQASAFTSCLFSLSGMFNVILFFKTRPQLIKGEDFELEHATEQGAPPQSRQRPHSLLPGDDLGVDNEKYGGYFQQNGEGFGDRMDMHLDARYKPTTRGREPSPSSKASILLKDRQVSQSPGRTPIDDGDDMGYLPR